MKKNFAIIEELKKRILVIDGAMGTNIKNYRLKEKDFRGELLKSFSVNQKWNNDLLSITNPIIIRNIHKGFLEAGADIIETNTLNSNRFSQGNYSLEGLVYKLNYYGAKIARDLCDEFKLKDGKKRYVAGSVGPTNRIITLRTDIDNTIERNIDFQILKEVYEEQISALIDGGIDIVLIETVINSINAKAAIVAANEVYKRKNKVLPIMVSATISNKSGKLLSGESLIDLEKVIKNENVISIGINCSFGSKGLLPFIKELSKFEDLFISIYPNAGFPNKNGIYEESPIIMARNIEEIIKSGCVNIVGGCCGTTFKHIEEICKMSKKYKPRKISSL